MRKYHRETVVLETIEGTADNKSGLKMVWEWRIKEYFPHYKIKSIRHEKDKGSMR